MLHWTLGYIYIYIYIFKLVFFGYMPMSGIAGSYGSSIFTLSGIAILFSIMVVSMYFPTKSVGGFPFLHNLYSLAFIICILFGHSDHNEMIPHCSFHLISLMINDIEHLFMYFFCHLYVFFEEIVSLDLLPIFWLGCFIYLFFILSPMSYCIFWRLIPSVVSFANIFSHSVSCLFILFVVYFAMQTFLILFRSLI